MPNAQIIPFPGASAVPPPPPPPAPAIRAMLQPSVHKRGGRNFVYPGRVDDWHAPGAIVFRDETQCAVDAAWIVEHVLNVGPRIKPNIWPGVPGARDRALWLAQQLVSDGKRPRGYQAEGAAFAAERDYAAILDWPGGGKTLQALIAAEARLSLGVVPDLNTPVVLVLCPALAKQNWKRQIKRWIGYDSTILEGRKPEELPTTRYVIANYEILFGDRRADAMGVLHDVDSSPGWAQTLSQMGFLICIADEIHLLSGRTSLRAKAVRLACQNTPVVWGLTGTLMRNYVRDIWGVIDFLTKGLFGNYYQFVRAYCDAHQGQFGMNDHGASRQDELGRRLGFFMIGRTAKDVQLELPPLRREKLPIDVEISAPTVHEGRAAMDKTKAVMSALRRTAVAKRSAIVNTAVEALQTGQKVVVYLYMREQCDAIAKAIKHQFDCTMFVVNGDMSPEARDRQANTFRDCGAPACFVATIDSVGLAISLVGADLVLFGDLVPEPWKMYQAELRCHRFDSTKPVLVYYGIAAGTIDERYAEMVIAKIEEISNVMGSGGDQAGLSATLGGKSSEEIIDGLFATLKEMSHAT